MPDSQGESRSKLEFRKWSDTHYISPLILKKHLISRKHFREALLWEDGPCILFRRVMQAKSSFFVLQALDLATILVAFHFGAFEVNPLVGHGRLAARHTYIAVT